MTLTGVYLWRLNNLPASTENLTNTNLDASVSFNTHTNDVEQLAHTTFDDAIETTTQQFDLSTTNHVVQDSMDLSATINEVLARPFLIQDIHLAVPGKPILNSFSIPFQAQPFVQTIDLPSAILNDPNKISKLEYFRYFTADMRIRIETNAQPYMSGKFWIFYNPYPNLTVQGTDVSTSSMTCLTSYPGVEYDLNQMSNAEIKIPFISYERAFDMETAADYCRLYVSQLTPIRDVTTETRLRMRIYGWFENIKVFGATSRSNLSAEYLHLKVDEYKTRLANIQINAIKEQSKGPISSVASTVKSISSKLTGLPVIGDIASSVSFVSDIVGNVASIFGFSRPTTIEPVCKVANIPGHGYTYYKSIDQSVALSSQPDNELNSQKDVFQTEMDEMQIEYIARNPGVIAVIPYTATSDNTSWMYSMYCSVFPTNYADTPSEAAIQRFLLPTCAEYISQLFSLWRGTMCVKISLAKTPFHNGRLLISYDPSNSITDTPLTRLGKTYTTILDLSENSSIVVKIPFLSKFDYLNTVDIGDGSGIEARPERFSFGTLSIGALAPLLGPATVSDTVDIIVWKWFEDLELAEPTSVTSYCVGVPASRITREVSCDIQINLMNRDEENVVIFNNPITDNSLIHAEQCIGEKITNCRQLLRMHRKAYVVNNGSEVTPFRDIAAGGTNFTYANKDYVTYLSRMYRFFRGGFSVKIFSNVVNSDVYMTTCLRRRLGRQLDNSANAENTPTHRTVPILNPFHEVRIPFYSQTYRRVINNEYLNISSLDYSYPVLTVDTNHLENSDLYVAGDDNLSYGWLIGPPMLGFKISEP